VVSKLAWIVILRFIFPVLSPLGLERFLVYRVSGSHLLWYFGRKFISRAVGAHKIWKIKLKGAERISIPDAFPCRSSGDPHLMAGPLKRAHTQLTNMELIFFITDYMAFTQSQSFSIKIHNENGPRLVTTTSVNIVMFLGPLLFPP